jgi:hypothetical protein
VAPGDLNGSCDGDAMGGESEGGICAAWVLSADSAQLTGSYGVLSGGGGGRVCSCLVEAAD